VSECAQSSSSIRVDMASGLRLQSGSYESCLILVGIPNGIFGREFGDTAYFLCNRNAVEKICCRLQDFTRMATP
jgi:hypothetical protein